MARLTVTRPVAISDGRSGASRNLRSSPFSRHVTSVSAAPKTAPIAIA